LSVASPRYGVSDRQLSLLMPTRTDPLTVLPPDLVTVLTTPPWNRPYSMGTAPVDTRVSATASAM